MQDGPENRMNAETTSWTDPAVDYGTGVLKTIEDGANAAGRATWDFFHHVPGHGTLLGGAVGLGAAMLVGVAELATACFTAYVSYRIFAYGESLSEAVENAIKFEGGRLEKEERDKPIPD